MIDIAYRLRNSYRPDNLFDMCNEAADEIDRLIIVNREMADKCRNLEAEVARLERLSNG